MKQKTLFIFLCITLGGIQPTQSQQKIDNEWWYEQRGVYVMEDYDGHKGCRSKEKEIIVPCQFDEIIFGDIAMSVEKDGKFGVYGYDGKLIYDVIYDEKIYFIPTRKAYPLYLGSKVGAGDTEGNILVPIEYEYVTEAVAGEKDIFLVNKGGRIKPNSYKSIDDVVGGKWGYYAYGQEIIPCQYDRAGRRTVGLLCYSLSAFDVYPRDFRATVVTPVYLSFEQAIKTLLPSANVVANR